MNEVFRLEQECLSEQEQPLLRLSKLITLYIALDPSQTKVGNASTVV